MEKARSMLDRKHPIIWIVGATRSSKTALAQGLQEACAGFHLTSTGDYFREQYGEEDTYSREFVFNISANSANCLGSSPSCHLDYLEDKIQKAGKPFIIEGERNPFEFSQLYNPKQDMVFFLTRLDIPVYNTTIERGISVIEQQVRWAVSNNIAPDTSATSMIFGNDKVKIFQFPKALNQDDHGVDEVIIEGPTAKRKMDGTPDEKYPWINILIGYASEHIKNYYGPKSCSIAPTKKLIP